MSIEWNSAKARTNQRKHGISFDDAQSVFDDLDRVDDFDEREYGEERWTVIGMVGSVILFVVYAQQDGDIRIISARKAAPHEEARYFSRTRWG